jgi:hypothetical protein
MIDTYFIGYNISNIGGIIGLGYNMSSDRGGSVWTNSSVADNLEFAVKLRPSPDDWSWNPDAPKITDDTSYLYLGGVNDALLN